jgi:hypothetical protein
MITQSRLRYREITGVLTAHPAICGKALRVRSNVGMGVLADAEQQFKLSGAFSTHGPIPKDSSPLNESLQIFFVKSSLVALETTRWSPKIYHRHVTEVRS